MIPWEGSTGDERFRSFPWRWRKGPPTGARAASTTPATRRPHFTSLARSVRPSAFCPRIRSAPSRSTELLRAGPCLDVHKQRVRDRRAACHQRFPRFAFICGVSWCRDLLKPKWCAGFNLGRRSRRPTSVLQETATITAATRDAISIRWRSTRSSFTDASDG